MTHGLQEGAGGTKAVQVCYTQLSACRLYTDAKYENAEGIKMWVAQHGQALK
jgi:hypothetical protein